MAKQPLAPLEKVRRAVRAIDAALTRVATVLTILLVLGVLSAGSGAVAGIDSLLFVGIVVGALSLLLVGTRTLLGAARRFRRRRRQHPYTILEKELFYEYSEGKRRMYQVKRFRIRANRDGVRIFEDRYRWSGSGDVKTRLIRPGPERRGRLDGPRTAGSHRDVQEDMWSRYEVEWEPSLRKGDELEIEVRWDLDNSTGDARDFYSTTVDFPTKKLSMEVRLPMELAADWVVRSTYEYFTATEPLEERMDRLEGSSTRLEWSIGKPQLGYRYVIRWGQD